MPDRPSPSDDVIIDLLSEVDMISVVCISEHTMHTLVDYRDYLADILRQARRADQRALREMHSRVLRLIPKCNVHAAGAPCEYYQHAGTGRSA